MSEFSAHLEPKFWNLKKSFYLTDDINNGYVNSVKYCRNNNLVVKKFSKRFDEIMVENSCIAQSHIALYYFAPRIVPTQKGKLFKKIGENYFVITEYVPRENRIISYKKKDDVKAFGRSISLLHTYLNEIKHRLKQHHLMFNTPDVEVQKLKYGELMKNNDDSSLKTQYALLKEFQNEICPWRISSRDVIHGDLCLGNMLKTTDDVKYIDFDQVSLFPRIYEIIRFLVTTYENTNSSIFQRNLSIFLNEYSRVITLSDSEIENGFNFYYMNLILNLRCYDSRYKTKDNNLFIEKRVNRMLWFRDNFIVNNNPILS